MKNSAQLNQTQQAVYMCSCLFSSVLSLSSWPRFSCIITLCNCTTLIRVVFAWKHVHTSSRCESITEGTSTRCVVTLCTTANVFNPTAQWWQQSLSAMQNDRTFPAYSNGSHLNLCHVTFVKEIHSGNDEEPLIVHLRATCKIIIKFQL